MVISVEQVINRTKMRLRLNNTENDAYLEKIIDEGARHLKSLDIYIVKCEEIPIECNKAKLPDFFEEFLGASFPGNGCSGFCASQGTTIVAPGSIETVYRPPCTCPLWFVSSFLLNSWSGTASCAWYGNYFNINGNYITLPSTITNDTIKVWYRSKNTDCDGLMIINEDWERGLSAYAAFNYANDYYESYTTEQRRNWQGEWVAQKSSIKGGAQYKRFKLDKQAINQIMNAILWDNRWEGVVGFPSIT